MSCIIMYYKLNEDIVLLLTLFSNTQERLPAFKVPMASL